MKVIQELVNENKTAESIFYVLALRTRNRKEFNLKRFKKILIKQGLEINDEDFIRTFKTLEQYQLGKFTKRSTYFQWFKPLRLVSFEALKQELIPSSETRNRKSKSLGKPLVIKTLSVPVKTIQKDLIIVIPLNNGETYNLEIKSGLSIDQLNKINKLMGQ